MLSLGLPAGPLRLLCLGAHADDIEIGCGGTVLRLLAERPRSHCAWVVFSGAGERAAEAKASAALFLKGAGGHRVDVQQFRDGYFPTLLAEIKDVFERLKQAEQPDLVLTHYREDRHQDHRVISDLTWQTFRDHWILEYEVPKYDGDLGSPNCYFPLSDAVRQRKVDQLLAAFPTQREKRWFSDETFMALMRLRGIECAAPEGYAEAFYARKVLLRS